jgi:hypothetical protein
VLWQVNQHIAECQQPQAGVSLRKKAPADRGFFLFPKSGKQLPKSNA